MEHILRNGEARRMTYPNREESWIDALVVPVIATLFFLVCMGVLWIICWIIGVDFADGFRMVNEAVCNTEVWCQMISETNK